MSDNISSRFCLSCGVELGRCKCVDYEAWRDYAESYKAERDALRVKVNQQDCRIRDLMAVQKRLREALEDVKDDDIGTSIENDECSHCLSKFEIAEAALKGEGE